MRIKTPRPIPSFEGELVLLRPARPEADAGNYYHLNLERELHEWTGNNPLASPEAAQAELERLASLDFLSLWLLEDLGTGSLAGRFFLSLEERDGERIAGDGIRIAKRFWRKGHCKEARRILSAYAFETLGAVRFETEAWAGNVNSVKSIEAFGFQLVSEELSWNAKRAEELPLRRYALAKRDWERRDGL
jgi:RimJ/RimL family protein N-acetyltransferase